MSDNFRQAVEKILAPAFIPRCNKADDVSAFTNAVDAVCAEVSKLAEGMPKPTFLGEEHQRAALAHMEECQAFIRKELQ